MTLTRAPFLADLVDNGACDSFVTLGAASGPSCATADPSFSREAFLKHGRIEKGSGWFCVRGIVCVAAHKERNCVTKLIVWVCVQINPTGKDTGVRSSVVYRVFCLLVC